MRFFPTAYMTMQVQLDFADAPSAAVAAELLGRERFESEVIEASEGRWSCQGALTQDWSDWTSWLARRRLRKIASNCGASDDRWVVFSKPGGKIAIRNRL